MKKTYLILIGAGLFLLGVLIYFVMRGSVEVPPVIDVFGIFNIHVYGVIIFTAIVTAALLSKKLLDAELGKVNIDLVEALIYIMVPAVVGARIYHVLTDYQLYRNNFMGIFAIWNGGLGLIGGLLGGLLGLYVFVKLKKLNFAPILRAVIVAVPLGQAVGRLGNLVNQEIFGPPTDSMLGMYVRIQNRPAGYEQYEFFQPLFLYEMIANLILAAVLFVMWKRGVDAKNMLFTYVAGYGAIRYFLDFFRLEGASGFTIGGIFLTYTQWLVLAILLFVIVFGWSYQLWYKRKYGKWFTQLNQK
jgi:prolipoprotein diacylglyceryl transferase